MKGKLQSAMEYLKQTEPAVKNLFEDLEEYDSIRKKIMFPVCIAPYALVEESGPAFKKWQRENKAAWKQASERLHKYLGYQISINTLYGSIFQIAFVGICLYSKNRVVPSELSSIVGPGTKAVRFCIGRPVRGVPIGLIIYAGRNQYNHWEEKSLREVNARIFDILATNHGIKDAAGIREPAFALNNERVLIYSSNLAFILGWKSYDPYYTDMKNLLTEAI